MDLFSIESLGSLTEVKTGETWNSARLKEEILRRASMYSAAKIECGDKIILLHNNNNKFFADLFALWMVGACVSCLDSDIGRGELEGVIGELDPRGIVVNGGLPDHLAGLDGDVTIFETRDAASWDANPVVVRNILDAPALILYTSGSTGLPKGVVHSLRTLQAKWFSLRHYVPLDVCETTLCLLPTTFGHGLICNALYPLVHGKHVVVLPKTDMSILSGLGKTIDQYGITFMSSVPTVWRMALRLSKPPQKGTLRQIHIGSAPLSAALWSGVQKWSGINEVWNTYGITETGSWIGGGKVGEETVAEDGLVGYGWGADFMITSHPDPDGIADQELGDYELPSGEVGHVWIRTPCVMQAYFKRPDETKKVLYGGWFNTGDLGRMDAKGRLHLTGRERNEINKGGTKISPEEVDLIIERQPEVAEACAFAFEDKIFGENIGICLVFNEDHEQPSAQKLQGWCKANMSEHKIPARWYSVKEIPKTPRGKIKRSDVAEYCSTRELLK